MPPAPACQQHLRTCLDLAFSTPALLQLALTAPKTLFSHPPSSNVATRPLLQPPCPLSPLCSSQCPVVLEIVGEAAYSPSSTKMSCACTAPLRRKRGVWARLTRGGDRGKNRDVFKDTRVCRDG